MSREILGAILGSYTRLIAEVEEIKECLQQLKSSILHKSAGTPVHKKSVWPNEEQKCTVDRLQPKNGTCVWMGGDESSGDKKHHGCVDEPSLGMLPARKISRHGTLILSSDVGKTITEDCKTEVCGMHFEHRCERARPCFSQDVDGGSHSVSGSAKCSHYTADPRTSGIHSKLHHSRPKYKRISKAQEVYQGGCSFNTCRELFPILEMEIKESFN